MRLPSLFPLQHQISTRLAATRWRPALAPIAIDQHHGFSRPDEGQPFGGFGQVTNDPGMESGIGQVERNLLGGPYCCCLPEVFFHIDMNALASKPIIFSLPTVMTGTPLPPSCLNLAAP